MPTFAHAWFCLLQVSWMCRKCALHVQKVPHILGGYLGKHIVSELQLNEMCRDVERQVRAMVQAGSLEAMARSC